MAFPKLELDLRSSIDVTVTVLIGYALYLWLTKEHAPAVDYEVEVPAACRISSDELELLQQPSIQVCFRWMIVVGTLINMDFRSPDLP